MQTSFTLQTIVETPEFMAKAKKILTEDMRIELINYLAANPLAGNVIKETGGIRKLRWRVVVGKGKSGGARVIYFYHDRTMPIFLLTLYLKSKQENLTKVECHLLQKVTKQIIEIYKRGNI